MCCKIFSKMIGFKKKTPKEWVFGNKPVVTWAAKNNVKFDMTTMTKIILTQILGLEDIDLVVITNDKAITKFDTNDLELQAILQADPDRHRYRLTYHSRVGAANMLPILCHEMIHLKQHDKGELKLVKGGAIWKGTFYDKEIPYFERPWEIEANDNMTKIEKKAKELYYE